MNRSECNLYMQDNLLKKNIRTTSVSNNPQKKEAVSRQPRNF